MKCIYCCPLKKQTCRTVPGHVITELSWQVILNFLPVNCLLHCQRLSRRVREAAREHMDQGFLHMKTLILAPTKHSTVTPHHRQAST